MSFTANYLSFRSCTGNFSFRFFIWNIYICKSTLFWRLINRPTLTCTCPVMGWPRKVSGYITVWSAELTQLIHSSSNIPAAVLVLSVVIQCVTTIFPLDNVSFFYISNLRVGHALVFSVAYSLFAHLKNTFIFALGFLFKVCSILNHILKTMF